MSWNYRLPASRVHVVGQNRQLLQVIPIHKTQTELLSLSSELSYGGIYLGQPSYQRARVQFLIEQVAETFCSSLTFCLLSA